ncbi:MAG: response regulator transcription factor [Phycisphaerales bacterium]|nr:response regulator transcription factor [Phycisphaerales bacterium]MCB9863142.1 response regulator transcription factor [Phycisphaerales bacterium]
MRILVIEDNPKVSSMLERGLVEQGFSIVLVGTGYDGEEKATSESFDVIILDVMLPDLDGLSVCRNIRQAGVTTPILMLTALSDTSDKVSGLNAGADDYLVKPFEYDELIARINALFRRSDATAATVLTHHDVSMDLARRTVVRQGKSLNLSNKEFMLLQYFIRNPDRVLSRTAIADKVWNLDLADDSNVIDVCVSTLRRKVDKPFDPPLIHTVVGAGYLFGADGIPQ